MIIRGNISRGGVEIQKAALPRRVRAFTLIEMMVVTAIIAILAAIFVGALPAIGEKKTRSSVRAELRKLTTAIEAYKEKNGFYPPDNTNNIAQPPLFYELVGTSVRNNAFYPLNGERELTQQQIENNFAGIKGFMNSAPEASEVKNFYETAKTNSHYIRSPFAAAADPVMVLRVPAKGPKNPAVANSDVLNTWKYLVAKPGGVSATNNPNSFDLWAEVIIRGRTNVIGNWKEE